MISLDEFKEAWKTIFDFCASYDGCKDCPVLVDCVHAVKFELLTKVCENFIGED